MAIRFELMAGIYFPRKDGPDMGIGIDIASFGIRVGKEISDISPNSDGTLLDIIASLENMKRPSPLTFSWLPAPNRKQLFQDHKKTVKSIEISGAFFGEKGQVLSEWDYTFDGISQVIPKKERRGNKTYERIDAIFMKMTPPGK